MSDMPKGFTCECGKQHDYPAYVYAHWDVPLVHTCDKCGRQHDVLRGKATLSGSEDSQKKD